MVCAVNLEWVEVEQTTRKPTQFLEIHLAENQGSWVAASMTGLPKINQQE